MTTPQNEFNYTKYQNPSITVEQLDGLASAVFNPNGSTGWIAIGWTMLKLIAAVAYVWCRNLLVSQQEQLALQQYQVAQTNQNQHDVNNQDPTPH